MIVTPLPPLFFPQTTSNVSSSSRLVHELTATQALFFSLKIDHPCLFPETTLPFIPCVHKSDDRVTRKFTTFNGHWQSGGRLQRKKRGTERKRFSTRSLLPLSHRQTRAHSLKKSRYVLSPCPTLRRRMPRHCPRPSFAMWGADGGGRGCVSGGRAPTLSFDSIDPLTF